ncbi:MAG: hypothetical protein ACI9LT_003247 [Pseudoalteromonas distincta]|jgi:hypothetical protein
MIPDICKRLSRQGDLARLLLPYGLGKTPTAVKTTAGFLKNKDLGA